MKRLAPLFLLLILLINSCKSSKVVPKTITGLWTLESIEHSNAKNTHKQLFLNDAIESCFKQSHWNFKANSIMGNYFINDLYCKFGERGFTIMPLEANKKTGLYDFLFTLKTKKNVPLNENSITIKLMHLTEQSMQWQLINPEDTSNNSVYINFKKEIKKQQKPSS